MAPATEVIIAQTTPIPRMMVWVVEIEGPDVRIRMHKHSWGTGQNTFEQSFLKNVLLAAKFLMEL